METNVNIKQQLRAHVLVELYNVFEAGLPACSLGDLCARLRASSDDVRDALRYLSVKGLVSADLPGAASVTGEGIDLYESIAQTGDQGYAQSYHLPAAFLQAVVAFATPSGNKETRAPSQSSPHPTAEAQRVVQQRAQEEIRVPSSNAPEIAPPETRAQRISEVPSTPRVRDERPLPQRVASWALWFFDEPVSSELAANTP